MWLLNIVIFGVIFAAVLDAGVTDVALFAAAAVVIALEGILSLIGWG